MKARKRQWLLVNKGFLGIDIVKAVMHRNGDLVVSRLYSWKFYTDKHGY